MGSLLRDLSPVIMRLAHTAYFVGRCSNFCPIGRRFTVS